MRYSKPSWTGLTWQQRQLKNLSLRPPTNHRAEQITVQQ